MRRRWSTTRRLTVIALWLAMGLTTAPLAARECEHCPALVPIPQGRALIGSPADEPERESWQAGTESPEHEVAFPRGFELAPTPVTVADFRRFARATGHDTSGGCHTFDGTDWTNDEAASWDAPAFAQGDDHPAVCLGWHDAMAYIGWLNAMRPEGSAPYRLPTEAEREYAARAGTTTPFWFGRTISPDRASYDTREVYAGATARAPYQPGTVPVRRFAANPWGLYGVHGGVWEWTADCYVASHAGKTAEHLGDGSIPRTGHGCDRRVLRGGAFNRHPRTLRAAYRTGLDPGFRGHSIGFRVAR